MLMVSTVEVNTASSLSLLLSTITDHGLPDPTHPKKPDPTRPCDGSGVGRIFIRTKKITRLIPKTITKTRNPTRPTRVTGWARAMIFDPTT
jgi:hypothetical protein